MHGSRVERPKNICQEALMMISEHVIGANNIIDQSLTDREMMIARYLKQGHGTSLIAQKLDLPLSDVVPFGFTLLRVSKY